MDEKKLPRCICPEPKRSSKCPGPPACPCPLHFGSWREYVEADRRPYVPEIAADPGAQA